MSPLLEVRDLRVTFDTAAGPLPVVDGVSFAVDAADTVALVGESGCGKTVTALAIMRLIEPPGRIGQSSSVHFAGSDLLAMPAAGLRAIRGARLGMAFSDSLAAFDPLLPVGAQVADTILQHDGGSRAAAAARAIGMLERTGLAGADDLARRYPHELSGGQRQRAALAMALVLRPALLIADEPTSALDVSTQAQVLDLLRTLRDEFGTALLLITHDFGVAAEATARAVVMYAGQVVEEAATATLTTAPLHPYTRALIEAWPRLGRDRGPLPALAGMAPAPADWPAGCRFHDRCAVAWDRCASEAPALVRADSARSARCHLVTRGTQ